MPVGQEVISYCSSCKLDLKHVIVAHKSGNSGAIAKVRCNTCMKIHAFRANPGTKAIEAAARRKAAGPKVKAQIIPVEVEWREQMSKAENKASQAYAPSKEFKAGDVIEHPTFGPGFVKTIKDGNKFEVIFQQDVKTLIHKHKGA
ncbi:MAG: hypothetical protein ACXVB9_03085 [Bdellovibrionota bacterium]